MSLDDIYNNFKIVEQEVRGTTSTNTIFQNMAFLSSPSPNSTSNVPIVFGVSTANLEQIYEDDLEEIDLKWQLALLSIRAKRFFQKTGKKITINGSDIAGYDKSKVECLNIEDTSSKEMVAIDGAGFDLSYMADDEALTNMAYGSFRLRGDCGLGFDVGKLTSTSLEELQWFNFFLDMGITDILATFEVLGE
nr:ribonuclease H-like domain-containing protein [Tanacetum cinerariifolium]